VVGSNKGSFKKGCVVFGVIDEDLGFLFCYDEAKGILTVNFEKRGNEEFFVGLVSFVWGNFGKVGFVDNIRMGLFEGVVDFSNYGNYLVF